MLVNTIIKESASGVNLKAEIRTNNETPDFFVKYYMNGELNKITRYPFQNIQQIEEQIENWMNGVQHLNG
jgi:hypothetical protein